MKNTKVNQITIIFNLVNDINFIEKSFKSIIDQKNVNFNLLLFIDHDVNQETIEFVRSYQFNTIDVEFCFLSVNSSLAFSFDEVIISLKTNYFYYLLPGAILSDNFISTFYNVIKKNSIKIDIFSFLLKNETTIKKDNLLEQINSPKDEFLIKPIHIYFDKIYNKNFIINNKIKHTYFKNYPLCFYIDLFKNNPVWFQMKTELVSITSIKYNFFSKYNIYDTLNQCKEIVNAIHCNNKCYEAKHYQEIEYLCVIKCIKIFMSDILKMDNKKIFNDSLEQILTFFDSEFHNWQKNIYLDSKINKNKPVYLSYISNFKPYHFFIKKRLSKFFND